MKNHMISDPNDEFFLTTCFVCGNKSKSGENHIRNYGGVVCFSCRQFFRRAHQKSKAPKFQCKNGGDCNITNVYQGKCKKCRYTLCLAAGMRPSCVLTKDQKMDRFQRRLKQKQNEASIKAAQRQETSINKNIQQRRRSLTDAQKEKFHPKKVFRKVSRVEDKLEILKQQRMNFHRNLWFQPLNRKQHSPDENLRIPNKLPIQSLAEERFSNPGAHWQHCNQSREQLFPSSYSEFVQPYNSVTNVIGPRSYLQCDPGFTHLAKNRFQSLEPPQKMPKEKTQPKVVLSPAKFNPEVSRNQPYLQNQNGILKHKFSNNNNSDSTLGTRLITAPDAGSVQPNTWEVMSQLKLVNPSQQFCHASLKSKAKILRMRETEKKLQVNLTPSDHTEIKYTSFSTGAVRQQKSDVDLSQPPGTQLHLYPTPVGKTDAEDKQRSQTTRAVLLNLRKIEPPPTSFITQNHFNKIRDAKRRSKAEIEPLTSKSRKVENESSKNFDLWPSFMLDTIYAILSSFRKAFEESSDVSSLTVMQRLAKVPTQFKEFALQQREFCLFEKTEQEKVLAQNAPIFIQLYLTCLMFQHFGMDFAKVKIFKSGLSFHAYTQIMSKLQILRLSEIDGLSVLAYIILFNKTDQFITSKPESFSVLRNSLFHGCIENRFENCLSMTGMFENLRQMALIASRDFDWTQGAMKQVFCPWVPHRPCFLSFTTEENYWLTSKLRLVDKVFCYVPLSDDVIKEMLNLSFGLGTKDNFLLPKLLQVFMQRVWTLMSCHSEFDQLPMLQKANQFRRAGASGITLFLLKKEPTVCESIEQLQEEFSLLDEYELKQQYLQLFKRRAKKVKKMWWLRGQLDSNTSSPTKKLQLEQLTHLSPKQLESYATLVKEVAHVVKDPVQGKLLILLALTSSNEPAQNSFSKLHAIYQKMFWKKMYHYFWKSFRESGGEDGYPTRASDAANLIVGQVLSTLHKVSKFCAIFSRA